MWFTSFTSLPFILLLIVWSKNRDNNSYPFAIADSSTSTRSWWRTAMHWWTGRWWRECRRWREIQPKPTIPSLNKLAERVWFGTLCIDCCGSRVRKLPYLCIHCLRTWMCILKSIINSSWNKVRGHIVRLRYFTLYYKKVSNHQIQYVYIPSVWVRWIGPC